MCIIDIGTGSKALGVIVSSGEVLSPQSGNLLHTGAVEWLISLSSHKIPGARHIQDHTENVLVIDEPVISELDIHGLVVIALERLRPLAERPHLGNCLKIGCEIHIRLVVTLIDIEEGVGLLRAVVDVSPEILLPEEAVRTAEIHAAHGCAERAVEAGQSILLGLDVDDTALTLGIVLGGRIGNELEFLDAGARSGAEQCLKSLSVHVGRSSVDPHRHGLAVESNVAVLVDDYSRSLLYKVHSRGALGKCALADIHHDLVHLHLDQLDLLRHSGGRKALPVGLHLDHSTVGKADKHHILISYKGDCHLMGRREIDLEFSILVSGRAGGDVSLYIPHCNGSPAEGAAVILVHQLGGDNVVLSCSRHREAAEDRHNQKCK